MFNESLWRTYSGVYSENLKKHFLLDVCSTLVFHELYIYIYLCGLRVLSHTFDLVLYYLSAFQKYLFRKFQILVITHLTSGLTYPTYRYYKESIVCRRALLVGLPVFDVIDQITYLS